MSKFLNIRTIHRLSNDRILFNTINIYKNSIQCQRSLHQQGILFRKQRPQVRCQVWKRPLSVSAPLLSPDLEIPPTPSLPLVDPAVSSSALEEAAATGIAQLEGVSPTGLVAHLLDLIHSSTGLPWWLTIALSTLMIRILLFPLVVKTQRNTIRMSNHMPQIQKIQAAMMQARVAGDKEAVQKHGLDLGEYMKVHKVNPFAAMLPALCQAPVFISFFLTLRNAAALPVEGFMTGGAWWFTDLTVMDPYLALPLITSATLFVSMEIGADGMKSDQIPQLKYFVRALPVMMLPFTATFPAAVLCYWCSNNLISLGLVSLLRIEPVRQFLQLPKMVPPPVSPDKNPFSQSFLKSFNQSMDNIKLAAQMEERKQMDLAAQRKSKSPPPT